MTDIKMGEHQDRGVEKFAPIVRCAKLDKDCEGCQAARRVLDINQQTNAMAVKKVKEQYKQIQQLQADRDELDVYKAYCLYQLGCLRTVGEKYYWDHVLSFSTWRKQQIGCGYIKDNKFVNDSTREG